MRHTRFRLGFLWKEGKAKGDYSSYYDEFKDDVDLTITQKEVKEADTTSINDKIVKNDKVFIDLLIKTTEAIKEAGELSK